jgi:hypothetical protein
MRLLHHHGQVVGWQRSGRRYVVPLWLYRRAERAAGCPGGAVCAERHEVEYDRFVLGIRRERWWQWRG